MKFALPLLALAALLVLAGCDSNGEGTATPVMVSTPIATLPSTLPPTPRPTAVPPPTATTIPNPTNTPQPTPTATPGPLKVITGPTLLTADAAFGEWSPDGSRIAFAASDGEGEIGLHLMNADGSNQISLVSASELAANALWGAAWSPDGAKIAFIALEDRETDIYVVNVDGSNLQRLIESDAIAPELVWSTDGLRIAFTRTTFASEEDYEGDSDIYVMNADGSDSLQLTDNPGQDRWPVFLPNGQEIAFQSTRDGADSIYLINVDGSNLRLLTQVKPEPLPDDYLSAPTFQGRVAWSPDRTKIAVHTFDGKIVVANSDGSNRNSLPYGTGFEYYWGAVPSWSPDGRRIAFISGHDTDQGGYEIYVTDIDGSNLLRLTNTRTDDWNPVWSPDGKTIIYYAEGGGINNEQGGIFVVELGPITATDVADRPVESPPDVAMDKAALLALYAAADGPNWKYTTNWLSNRPLGDWYGVTTDSSGRVIRLELQANQLDGQIPIELGNLSNLTELNLSANELSQEIPIELGNLSNLTILNLNRNPLTGQIPVELGNLSSLTMLDLSYSRLTGQIPVNLGELTSLTRMHLHSSQLNGQIPEQLGSLPNLMSLALGDNSLSGEIPSTLGNLSNLLWLNLDRNDLSGEIPAELGILSNLRSLQLEGNRLSGEVPTELGNLSELTRLDLKGNQLSGELPQSLTRLTALETLDFNNNSGLCVPLDKLFVDWLDDLEGDGQNCGSMDRAALVAFYNATNGPNWMDSTNWLSDRPISEWHGVGFGGVSGQVTSINLRQNNLVGVIPPELGYLSKLRILILSENDLSGQIPIELGSLPRLSYLDLRANGLSGQIPHQLGDISNLILLDLSQNKLSEQIPVEMSILVNLSYLDVRGNMLRGELPQGFTGLTSLDGLYFGDNSGLCAPATDVFQAWLQGLEGHSGDNCATG